MHEQLQLILHRTQAFMLESNGGQVRLLPGRILAELFTVHLDVRCCPAVARDVCGTVPGSLPGWADSTQSEADRQSAASADSPGSRAPCWRGARSYHPRRL